jgi:hypothetical protein
MHQLDANGEAPRHSAAEGGSFQGKPYPGSDAALGVRLVGIGVSWRDDSRAP